MSDERAVQRYSTAVFTMVKQRKTFRKNSFLNQSGLEDPVRIKATFTEIFSLGDSNCYKPSAGNLCRVGQMLIVQVASNIGRGR